MSSKISVIKKIWNRILDAVAWLTEEQPRITARESRREIDYIRLRGFGKK
ncbi:MAG TPA: hypothetical protein VMW86_02810 [Dehalococcoidales bacterium]|nr:hypothetical protein [Dehalococcoidales bacterium]